MFDGDELFDRYLEDETLSENPRIPSWCIDFLGNGVTADQVVEAIRTVWQAWMKSEPEKNAVVGAGVVFYGFVSNVAASGRDDDEAKQAEDFAEVMMEYLARALDMMLDDFLKDVRREIDAILAAMTGGEPPSTAPQAGYSPAIATAAEEAGRTTARARLGEDTPVANELVTPVTAVTQRERGEPLPDFSQFELPEEFNLLRDELGLPFVEKNVCRKLLRSLGRRDDFQVRDYKPYLAKALSAAGERCLDLSQEQAGELLSRLVADGFEALEQMILADTEDDVAIPDIDLARHCRTYAILFAALPHSTENKKLLEFALLASFSFYYQLLHSRSIQAFNQVPVLLSEPTVLEDWNPADDFQRGRSLDAVQLLEKKFGPPSELDEIGRLHLIRLLGMLPAARKGSPGSGLERLQSWDDEVVFADGQHSSLAERAFGWYEAVRQARADAAPLSFLISRLLSEANIHSLGRSSFHADVVQVLLVHYIWDMMPDRERIAELEGFLRECVAEDMIPCKVLHLLERAKELFGVEEEGSILSGDMLDTFIYLLRDGRFSLPVLRDPAARQELLETLGNLQTRRRQRIGLRDVRQKHWSDPVMIEGKLGSSVAERALLWYDRIVVTAHAGISLSSAVLSISQDPNLGEPAAFAIHGDVLQVLIAALLQECGGDRKKEEELCLFLNHLVADLDMPPRVLVLFRRVARLYGINLTLANDELTYKAPIEATTTEAAREVVLISTEADTRRKIGQVVYDLGFFAQQQGLDLPLEIDPIARRELVARLGRKISQRSDRGYTVGQPIPWSQQETTISQRPGTKVSFAERAVIWYEEILANAGYVTADLNKELVAIARSERTMGAVAIHLDIAQAAFMHHMLEVWPPHTERYCRLFIERLNQVVETGMLPAKVLAVFADSAQLCDLNVTVQGNRLVYGWQLEETDFAALLAGEAEVSWKMIGAVVVLEYLGRRDRLVPLEQIKKELQELSWRKAMARYEDFLEHCPPHPHPDLLENWAKTRAGFESTRAAYPIHSDIVRLSLYHYIYSQAAGEREGFVDELAGAFGRFIEADVLPKRVWGIFKRVAAMFNLSV